MATPTNLQITPEGRDRLKLELATLQDHRLKELSEQIAQNSSEGDVSDNAEFEELKDEYHRLEDRVREIQFILDKSVVLEYGSHDGVIALGSRIRVQAEDDTEAEDWILVNEEESLARAGRISDESPVGLAMLGKRAGDAFTVTTPAGSLTYRILDVH